MGLWSRITAVALLCVFAVMGQNTAKCKSDICDPSDPSLVGLKLIMCGSGMPTPAYETARSCFAIQTHTDYLVFDAGPGSDDVLGTFNDTDNTVLVKNIFMTHYHSDHMGGLGTLLNQGWIGGRRGAGNLVTVYGPPGLNNIAAALRTMYGLDAHYRSTTKNANGTCVVGSSLDSLYFATQEVPLANTSQTVLVYSKNGLTVKTFLVNHVSAVPAYGYRIDYNGKSVVLSGDTIRNQNVIDHATGADVLIHETMNVTYALDHVEQLIAAGNIATANSFSCNVPGSHTSEEDLANIAYITDVKRLIITHIVPTPSDEDKRNIKKIIRAGHYRGDVDIAQDYDYWLL